jgi:hypothetical protein
MLRRHNNDISNNNRVVPSYKVTPTKYHTYVFVIVRLVFYNIKSGLIIALRFTMGFNATFNNISVISWQSVLLVEETRVPGENHRPVASHLQNL